MQPEVAVAATEWTGPVREGSAGEALEPIGNAWSENPDVVPAWADVSRIVIDQGTQNWRLELGADPPTRAELARAGQVLGFGFVMDTTGDGVADYVVGIDSDADAPAVHVWLTDLGTGETHERFSGPYGDPFDFATVLEGGANEPATRSGGVFFNVGFAPPELFDLTTTRFYAWSSVTQDGEVVAWDYAPDAGWLGAAPQERIGCQPLACPMTGPEPGPGARDLVINVENQSSSDTLLFVAQDTMPMGGLVGTAVPASVPPGISRPVVFTVPEGSNWAIFVNPSTGMGPLIVAPDVPPNAAGVLPLTITVQGGGLSTVSAPSAPGWFGN